MALVCTYYTNNIPTHSVTNEVQIYFLGRLERDSVHEGSPPAMGGSVLSPPISGAEDIKRLLQ